MNSNDFDEWNREAIISSALAYREKAEYYRRAMIDMEKAYNRLADERDRLREASEEIAEQARREEREHIANHLRTLVRWCDGTEMDKSDQWTMALAANEVHAMPEEARDET